MNLPPGSFWAWREIPANNSSNMNSIFFIDVDGCHLLNSWNVENSAKIIIFFEYIWAFQRGSNFSEAQVTNKREKSQINLAFHSLIRILRLRRESTPVRKSQINLAFHSLIRILRLRRESTPVRKCSNKFGISLTYSYFCSAFIRTFAPPVIFVPAFHQQRVFNDHFNQ